MRSAAAFSILCAVCATCSPGLAASATFGDSVPLPRPRPAEAGPSNRSEVPAEPAAEAAPSECFMQLTAGLALATRLPAIAEPNGCDAPDVVRLEQVMLPTGRRVVVVPAATLRCTMATAIANWVRDDLAPQSEKLGAPLAGIENFDSYECRGQNRIAGAKLSEHGRANALDVRSLTLADGRRLELTDPEAPRNWREDVRRSACVRFTTVLGPGSDGFHENHVHVDSAERRNGYRLCQWDVRDPELAIPLPRERPFVKPKQL